ncbi:MAG: DMT family transporter [Candidatus Thermoplasmatota archaeon]
MAELWLFLALGTMLAYGIGQVLQKVGTTGCGPTAMILFTALICGSIWGAWYILFRDEMEMTLYSLAVPLIGGALGMSGNVFFFEALARGNVSVVGTLVAAYPCVTVVAAFLLLDERLSAVRYAGVLLILLGIVVLSTGGTGSRQSVSKTGLMLAAASFLAFGLAGVTLKEAVRVVGSDNAMGFYALVYVLGGTSYWLVKRGGRSEGPVARMPRRAIGIGAVGLSFSAVGGILLIWALVDGPASIVITLSGAYPIVTIAAALVFLKEKVVARQGIGLAMVLVGLPFVSF